MRSPSIQPSALVVVKIVGHQKLDSAPTAAPGFPFQTETWSSSRLQAGRDIATQAAIASA